MRVPYCSMVDDDRDRVTYLELLKEEGQFPFALLSPISAAAHRPVHSVLALPPRTIETGPLGACR